MDDSLEKAACAPHPVDPAGFNPATVLPYGLETKHLQSAMSEFVDFLGFINSQLHQRGIVRMECLMMPASFSTLVSEFMPVAIPKYCPTLVKNQYHNGHPDILPVGAFPGNSAQHTNIGIEVKASRYLSGWQGHNAEEIWLLLFVYDSNRARDLIEQAAPKPFRFLAVYGAGLTRDDWNFSGRSGESRRTITASVTRSGYNKMVANWIYKDPGLQAQGQLVL